MNKQILTDIVNSILGLSKKKKKEFIELLDNGINKRELSDFNENDSLKQSFIKNRPFYDYNIPVDTLEFVSEDFDINTSGQSVYAHENKGLGFYVKDRNNIQLVVKSYQSGSSYTTRFLDTRYKLSDTVDYVSGQKSFNTIVNYYNNIPLTLKFKTFAINNNTNVEYDNTNVTVYCRYNSETEKFEFATRYFRNNSYSTILEGSVRTSYEDGYIYNISGIIYNLEYYKGKREIENNFKSLDEKFIPDTIKNRITALEQAVTELGGTLNS